MGIEKKTVRILSQETLADGIFSMWIEAGKIASQAVPGQFITLYSKDKSRLLPRPISICEVKPEEGALRIVYRIAGAGTKEFSEYTAGDTLDICGPLGNGYELSDEPAILVAGGIGIPPMLELAKRLSCEKTIVLGYRNDQCFLAEEFKACGRVVIATEDGSCGTKGTVLDAIRENKVKGSVIYSCGPTPMLKALKSYAAENGIKAWISLEEKMACGIGACLACVCKSEHTDHHTNVNNKRICKDGPVFDAQEVIL